MLVVNNVQAVLLSFLAPSNSVVYFRVAMRIRWVSLFSEALSLVSEDVGGDLTNFL